MFKKTYLTDYRSDQYQVIGGGTRFTLELKDVWFFGLFYTESEKSYIVSDWHKLRITTDRWDDMIRDKLDYKE